MKFNGLSWAADCEVHVVHISRVIIAYTLEWLSSLSYKTYNLQATINFKKKEIWKSEGHHPLSWLVIGDSDSTSVYIVF